MSATDELRKLLDECGVEWKSGDFIEPNVETQWGNNYYTDYPELPPYLTISNCTPEQAITATLGNEINGETSDGYHTFNELYHHRAVLFSVIVRDHSKRAWKARKHHDGTMYDGMFIVGIETPSGQATYHYDLDPYWDMFDCEEREFAPEWDGHTPDEAIARIATLGSGTCEFTIEYDRDEVERRRKMYEENPLDLFPQDMPESAWTCSNCGQQFKCHYDRQTGKLLPVPDWMKCCPSCGKQIRKAVER